MLLRIFTRIVLTVWYPAVTLRKILMLLSIEYANIKNDCVIMATIKSEPQHSVSCFILIEKQHNSTPLII